jgi:hypothetical protein
MSDEKKFRLFNMRTDTTLVEAEEFSELTQAVQPTIDAGIPPEALRWKHPVAPRIFTVGQCAECGLWICAADEGADDRRCADCIEDTD